MRSLYGQRRLTGVAAGIGTDSENLERHFQDGERERLAAGRAFATVNKDVIGAGLRAVEYELLGCLAGIEGELVVVRLVWHVLIANEQFSSTHGREIRRDPHDGTGWQIDAEILVLSVIDGPGERRTRRQGR